MSMKKGYRLSESELSCDASGKKVHMALWCVGTDKKIS